MYSVSPTGTLRWQKLLPGCAGISWWHRPVVANGVVYITSDAALSLG